MRRLLGTLAALFSLFISPANAETYLVLPFSNLSKSANLDWIGESISETIREALASLGLLVTERPDRQEVFRRLSLRQYALLTRASVIKVGEALDVDRIIYGRFELLPVDGSASRGSLRVTANILDLKSLRHGSEYVEIGALEDLAALQGHLAWQTLQFVAPATAPSEDAFRKSRPPIRLDAVENHIRGLLASNAEEKQHYLSEAARLDARYSQPCFELGRLLWEKKTYREAAGWLERVSAADPHFREATFLLGLSRYHLSDYPGAESAFSQVARTVPLNEVLNNLGAAQSRRNLPEALESFRKALEGDSADPVYHFNVGYALWKLGQFSAAADRFRAAAERDPQDQEAVLMLGYCLKKAGPRQAPARMAEIGRAHV